jgi:hypothetical protein
VSFGSFLEGVRSFEQETLYIGFIQRQTHFGMPSRHGRHSNSNATSKQAAQLEREYSYCKLSNGKS